MSNEKNIRLGALSDDELENISGGMGPEPLVFTGKNQPAFDTVQKGKGGKAKDLVHRQKKGTETAKKTIDSSSIEGILLSGGGDGPRLC